MLHCVAMDAARTKETKSSSMVHRIPRQYQRLFKDAICVSIPLEATADLGIAMRRTREKRIKKLFESFPELKKRKEELLANANGNSINCAGSSSNLDKEKNKDKTSYDASDNSDSDNDNDNDSKTNDKNKDKPNTKNKKNDHLPQRDDYASVLDYLEAKYVQGVMINDNDDNDNDNDNIVEETDDDDDDRGSVYSSDDDFLDDSILRRDVTEQVLSQSIHTKLEAEGDDDFFVNVGNLEVEDRDNLMDYDPLADDQKEKSKAKTKRKRVTVDTKPSTKKKHKKVTSITADSKSGSSKKKKNAHAAAAGTNKGTNASGAVPSSPKKGAKKNETEEKKNTATTVKQEMTKEGEKKMQDLKAKAVERKAEMKSLYAECVKKIKKMTDQELPRKKKHAKLSIVVPPGKKQGDNVTFSNPHVPGQKLRVKVPKDSVPGGKFVVSVPAPAVDTENSENKFPRDIQELLDDFSQSYDGWCQAQADYSTAAPDQEKFLAHKERLNKFEELLRAFPKNLITPIDAVYLRKVVRRARQNKQKRKKTMIEIQKFVEPEATTKGATKESALAEISASANAKYTTPGTTQALEKGKLASQMSPTLEVTVPVMKAFFPVIKFRVEDFQ